MNICSLKDTKEHVSTFEHTQLIIVPIEEGRKLWQEYYRIEVKTSFSLACFS